MKRLAPEMEAEIAAWPLEDRDSYEERAGIVQHDANRSRDAAEAAAYLEVKANRTTPATHPVAK